MRCLWAFLLLAGCAQAKPKPALVLSGELDYCNVAAHEPLPLPDIVTSGNLLRAYKRLEHARQAIEVELRECDVKRRALFELLKGK